MRDGTCQVIQSSVAKATSGTVTITAISGNKFSGSFDVALDSGDHISGNFDPNECPAIQNVIDHPSSQSCQ
jgi:hypothetical protein